MKQREIPKAGEFYRHFKMKYYQIITVATHTETREQMVVYQALYDDFGVYARPIEMFLSRVDKEKYPDVLQEYRFERVDRPYSSTESAQSNEAEKGKSVPTAETEEVKVSKVSEISNEIKKHTDSEEVYVMDPDVERFLDADTYKEKLNILMSLSNNITDKQLHDMAITLDVTIEEGSVDDKFLNLVNCLRTMARFEVNR